MLCKKVLSGLLANLKQKGTEFKDENCFDENPVISNN